MPAMNLKLNSREYADLVKALDLALVMSEDLAQAFPEYQMLRNRLTTLGERAAELGLEAGEKSVEECKHEDGETHAIPVADIDHFVVRTSAEYRDLVFWEELEDRLARRDYLETETDAEKLVRLAQQDALGSVGAIAESVGADGIAAASFPERMNKLRALWRAEFDAHGADRLRIAGQTAPEGKSSKTLGQASAGSKPKAKKKPRSK